MTIKNYTTTKTAAQTAGDIQDWLDAQLAILETEMVTIDQIMLPYFVNKNGDTAYELYQNKQLLLGTGG